jgi:hypothetical protein
MIRRLFARLSTPGNEPHGGTYCDKCAWWTKPACGH